MERAAIFLELQSAPQRTIASHLGISQPGVCYRLRAAKRRLAFLAKLPSPPLTVPELTSLGLSPRDSEILVALQSARAIQVERDLSLTHHGRALERARKIRSQLPPDSTRLRAFLDLVCVRGGFPYRAAQGDDGRSRSND